MYVPFEPFSATDRLSAGRKSLDPDVALARIHVCPVIPKIGLDLVGGLAIDLNLRDGLVSRRGTISRGLSRSATRREAPEALGVLMGGRVSGPLELRNGLSLSLPKQELAPGAK